MVPEMLARYITLSIGTTNLSPLCVSKECKGLGERQLRLSEVKITL